MQYPRVLIISNQSMHRNNGTGITMESLWNEWPTDKLKELYFEYNKYYEEKYNNSVCINTILPFRHIIEKIQNIHKKKLPDEKMSKPSGNIKKSWIKNFVFNICDLSFLNYSQKIKKLINQFEPDIIYTLGASVSVLKLSIKIAKKRNIPIVIHFMDNWAHYLQKEKFLSQKIYKKILLKKLKEAYLFCNKCITISPFMAEEYEKETGISHVSLMNSVDVQKFKCKEKIINNCTFVYAGGLHLGRWKSLIKIQECIKKINYSYGKKCNMIIYAKLEGLSDIISKFDSTIVEFKEYVPHEKIKEVYENSDVLIHCEDLESNINNFFKYSISTKIPEYLATGRPVLFLGPKDMELVNYLKNNNLSLVATNNHELEQSVKNVILNYKKVVNKYRNNALNYVEKNHNIINERKKLANIMNESIKERGNKDEQTF